MTSLNTQCHQEYGEKPKELITSDLALDTGITQSKSVYIKLIQEFTLKNEKYHNNSIFYLKQTNRTSYSKYNKDYSKLKTLD